LILSDPLYKIGMFGLMLLSVRQMMGTLDGPQGEKLTKIPVLLVFCLAYTGVLCMVEHKEHRFLLPVIVIS
jgi:hypothetical protein